MVAWSQSPEQGCVKRLFQGRIYCNRSRAQITNGVGEIPLNRNGLLLTHNGEDEEIVYSLWKHKDIYNNTNLIMRKG